MPAYSWKLISTIQVASSWKLSPFTSAVYFRFKFIPPIRYSKILIAQVSVVGGKFSILESKLIFPAEDWQILELLPSPILPTRQIAFKALAGERCFFQLEQNSYTPLPVQGGGSMISSDLATHFNIVASVASTPLLAANPDRKGASFLNDSEYSLFLKCGAGASSISHTVELARGDYFELPYGYRDVVTGAWAQTEGSCHVTEYE